MRVDMIPRLLPLWVIVSVGCGNLSQDDDSARETSSVTNDNGTDSSKDSESRTQSATEETDSSSSTRDEYDSLNDTNVCPPLEAGIELCAAAATREECQAASAHLPPLGCYCREDCSQYCAWVPAVLTELVGSDCSFGEIAFRCFFNASGEGSFSEFPPCGTEWNDDAAFSFKDGAATYLGFYWSNFVGAPPSFELITCDMETREPEPCGCLCDSDFPIQNLSQL